MAKKKIGISRDLIIHPGETIGDILKERGITQAELAHYTGVSPAYVSCVIAGKKDISPNFAKQLEYALDVPKYFWLKLQAHYDAELLEFYEQSTISEEEKTVKTALTEVIACLKKTGKIPADAASDELILLLRKALQIGNIANLKQLMPNGAFRMAKKVSVNPYVLGAWLRLCQISSETQNIYTKFNPSSVNRLIDEIKEVMLQKECDVEEKLTSVMAQHGIAFSIVPNFRGAPVHGYIARRNDDVYQMALTIRGAFADIFWFSLFHEIGHIINGDIAKTSKFIDAKQDSQMESAANNFAKDVLLEPNSYNAFLANGDFSITAIQQYAETQKVMPYIVIGRLQQEKQIPYTWFAAYKPRYKWAE